MLALAGILMFLGMVGAAVVLVMLTVRAVFKRGWTKKMIWTVGAISVVLFAVGLAMGWPSVHEGYGEQSARVKDSTIHSSSLSPSSPSLFNESVNNSQEVGQHPTLDKMLEKTATDKPTTNEQKEKALSIPELLRKDFKGIVQLLGKPTAEKTEGQDKKLVKYTLPGFELEISLFMDRPISMDITPLKEYKFINSTGYATSDVPDDVMQLLYDLGFSKGSVTGQGDTPSQRLFSYVDYGSPLKEYEIRVNSENWRAVSEGKASKVSWVYIKLIKTK